VRARARALQKRGSADCDRGSSCEAGGADQRGLSWPLGQDVRRPFRGRRTPRSLSCNIQLPLTEAEIANSSARGRALFPAKEFEVRDCVSERESSVESSTKQINIKRAYGPRNKVGLLDSLNLSLHSKERRHCQCRFCYPRATPAELQPSLYTPSCR
jgi:hypothetical protein